MSFLIPIGISLGTEFVTSYIRGLGHTAGRESFRTALNAGGIHSGTLPKRIYSRKGKTHRQQRFTKNKSSMHSIVVGLRR